MESLLEIARTKEGDYYFRIVGTDGQILAQSEDFETLAVCKSFVGAVRESIRAPIFEADGEGVWTGHAVYEVFVQEEKYTFLLKGDYGQVLIRGSRFDTMRACRAAISAMLKTDFDSETEYEVC